MNELHRWSGDLALREPVERALAADGGGGRCEVLRDNPRRRILALHCADGAEFLLKHFRVGSGRHPHRERWKARIGRAPAAREWRALRTLRRAGLPVPEPVALGELANGDRVLAMRFQPGLPLSEALAARGAERRALLTALGEAVARLHAAGWIHGDLHAGNILVEADRLLLLDWQHSGRSRSRRKRLRDLAQLDYSLWRLASRADRVRVRTAALGLERPWDASERRAIRGAGRAAERRAAEHAASRTRHALRSGRLYARLAVEGGRGFRLREVGAPAVEAALRAHHEALLARDGRVLKDDARARVTAVEARERRVVVKETPWRGPLRVLADTLRGSAGRRAWLGGHGLLARGVGAARPLAFVEWRRLAFPVRSLVILDDLRPAPCAVEALKARLGSPEELLAALARMAIALHARGADHGDFKGTHVLLRRREGNLEARLIDLEGVRFRRRLHERRRLQALVELNASLPDAYPAPARRRAFDLYVRVLPFRRSPGSILRELVALSHARDHRWSGHDCRLR
jgi:tRNA A-37 threonylcarbamoyl transferase component Bud32